MSLKTMRPIGRISSTFAVFEIFAIAGALYLATNLLLITLVRVLERHLNRHRTR
ncbi:hypothetical protein ACWGS9_15150 [Bradyrhizobium sp. Arg314]